MQKYFFTSTESLVRTAIIGVLAYIVLVLFLRISGKRTLSKLNAFDFIVTVALGSTLATVLLNKSVALADGALAFAVLIGLQFLVTWSSVRLRWVRRLATGEPQLLVYRGEFLPAALKSARITEDEIRAAVRANGLADLSEIEAVVLETDGSISVVQSGGHGASSLDGVKRSPAQGGELS